MSTKNKRNKSKIKADSKPTRTPRSMGSVWEAIKNDNPHELESILAGKNPFRLLFKMGYGDQFGIQTICGLMGAWDCLVWLQGRVRAQIDLDDLEDDLANLFQKDMDTASELLGTAVRNGNQKAENAFCELLYWVVKLSSEQDRILQKEFIYKDSPHYAHAEARVLAELEKELLSNPTTTLSPQETPWN